MARIFCLFYLCDNFVVDYVGVRVVVGGFYVERFVTLTLRFLLFGVRKLFELREWIICYYFILRDEKFLNEYFFYL